LKSNPARGRAGGRDGATGRLRPENPAREFPREGLAHPSRPGDRIIIEMPGRRAVSKAIQDTLIAKLVPNATSNTA
jgi:hypothetical protein